DHWHNVEFTQQCSVRFRCYFGECCTLVRGPIRPCLQIGRRIGASGGSPQLSARDTRGVSAQFSAAATESGRDSSTHANERTRTRAIALTSDEKGAIPILS